MFLTTYVPFKVYLLYTESIARREFTPYSMCAFNGELDWNNGKVFIENALIKLI